MLLLPMICCTPAWAMFGVFWAEEVGTAGTSGHKRRERSHGQAKGTAVPEKQAPRSDASVMLI